MKNTEKQQLDSDVSLELKYGHLFWSGEHFTEFLKEMQQYGQTEWYNRDNVNFNDRRENIISFQNPS